MDILINLIYFRILNEKGFAKFFSENKMTSNALVKKKLNLIF